MRTVIVWALAVVILSISTSSNANDIFIDAFGDSAEMSLIQDGDGNDIDFTLVGNNQSVGISQTGDSNTATITIDGTSPTTLLLDQTGNNLNYILNQYCTNVNGCSIIVTQN